MIKFLLSFCLALLVTTEAHAMLSVIPDKTDDEARKCWSELLGHDVFEPVYWLKSLDDKFENRWGCRIKAKASRHGIIIRLRWKF